MDRQEAVSRLAGQTATTKPNEGEGDRGLLAGGRWDAANFRLCSSTSDDYGGKRRKTQKLGASESD